MKKIMSVIIAMVMVAAMCAQAVPVSAQETMPTIERMSGRDRCETSCVIYENTRALENANRTTVLIASGTNFADALAAIPYAAATGRPIMLVSGKGAAEQKVLDKLRESNVEDVIILGGESAVSRETERSFNDAGIESRRIYGSSRYETAAKLATELSTHYSASKTIFLVSGENFPDALSVGAPAGRVKSAVLYSNKKGTIDEATAQYIREYGIDTAVIVGGAGAVGANAETELGKLGVESIRIYGENRFETSIKVYQNYWRYHILKRVSVATGTNFPDALAGGVYSALSDMPILLVNNNGDNSELSRALACNGENITEVVVYGGEGAVSDATIEKIFVTGEKRWTSEAALESVTENVREYAESVGMHWNTELSVDNAQHIVSDRWTTNTAYYTSADQLEKVLKDKIHACCINVGYDNVNVVFVDSGDGEYMAVCCFG